MTDKNVMVNATEMAKIFDKRVANFLRLDETKTFIEFQVKKNYIGSDVSRYIENNIYYSNNKAGTFMCRKLALKFAAWLDVEFEDWVFDTIDKIVFGNYKEHWDAHVWQEKQIEKKDELEAEFLLSGCPPEKFKEYMDTIANIRTAGNLKKRAIKNQYKLF